MSMFRAYSSRGAILIWRQGEGAPASATAAPRSKFQVFARSGVWVYSTPRATTSGGSTNLTVQDATHAHSVDSVVLTTDSFLTVSDATHAHTVDNVSLSFVTVTLAVQDATHEHTADNVELSGTGIEVVTERRRGGSRFALARKALLKRQLIEWLTKEEPSEEVKKAIQEVKAGIPVETTETPKPEPKIDPEELAKKLIPRRLIGLEDILTRSQFRIVRRAAQIAQERDDEDILMLL